MDYAQAIEYLLSFADFERGGRFQERPNVGPTLALLRRLGDPHLGRPTVHVAGSKGKGSTAAMVESILRAGGYRTGLYTSPHLHSYCERVRLDGKPIGQAQFARLVEQVRQAVEARGENWGERRLVAFDLLTAVGFLAFRKEAVRVQVVEVGLGGRLDSTNVFARKEVAVITPISLEHTAILGETAEAIAAEKAAIITPGSAAVVAPQPHAGAAVVICRAAENVGAEIVDVAEEYRWRRVPLGIEGQEVHIERQGLAVSARLPLIGAHQAENAVVAVAAVLALGERGYAVPPEALERGLRQVRWPVRLEVLRRRPLVLADGAHNRDSARRVRQALAEDLGVTQVTFVVGASADKDVTGLAEELAPLAERVWAVRARHPRALEPEAIAAAFAGVGVPVAVGDDVGQAVEEAMAASGRDGVICLLGSLFVAAEGRAHLTSKGRR